MGCGKHSIFLLFSATPDAWKRSILISDETHNNSEEHNLTSVNVTAKIAIAKKIASLPQWKINLDVFNIR